MSPTIPLLLNEFHNSPISGHQGVLKTYQRWANEVYWSRMKTRVQSFMAECATCQQAKYLTLTPAGLLQVLPIPKKIWKHIAMDFIEGLPKSEGYDTILVIVDRLSINAHFILLKHPFNAKTVATIFVKVVVRLHSVPRSIILDKDKIFTSWFWEELFRRLGTQLRSTAYHPQTYDQLKVVNQGMETYLRCFVKGTPKQYPLGSLGGI